MVEASDIQNLLSTGTWTTQKAKEPRPLNQVRASRLELFDPDDPKIPRSLPLFSHCRRPPPAPSVEDEDASVARELNGSAQRYDDEEPKYKGTTEQNPVLIPVHEYNAERRFVLVVPSETDEESSSGGSDLSHKSASIKIHLDAEAQPELQRRRSRVDLPRIQTDIGQHPQRRPPSPLHTSRSATCIEKTHPPDEVAGDYFSPHPEAARSAVNALLSPIIRHATKGRDRAYWNFNSPSRGADHRDRSPTRPPPSGRKRRDGCSRSPPRQRRLHSDAEVHRKSTGRHSSYRDETLSRMKKGPSSPPLERRQSPPRLTRIESSPAKPYADSPATPQNRSSRYGRPPPPREGEPEYSSDESRESKAHRSHHERRKSTVLQGDRRPALPSPVGPRPAPILKSKSRLDSPLPSPRVSEELLSSRRVQPDPRSSTTTFNVARDRRRTEIERPVSPFSSGGSSPRSRSKGRGDDRLPDAARSRASSRTPSIRSNTSATKPVNASLPATFLPIAILSDDRKRQTLPPSPAWSRQSSLETIPHPQPHWQPEPFYLPQQSAPLTPRQSGTNLEQPAASVVSYRRYSEDVNTGALPGLPHCPRQRPRSGLADWWTLPRYDNFNICPSCYEQVFQPTEFRNDFVAPSRSRDPHKEIACDLGTSPWYRIAWLMTRKYRRSDLRLLQGIADVSAKHRAPCYGPAKVTRIWHSIVDPEARRCIPDFTVCSPCAEAVQMLFPSLTGVFVAQDRQAEPRPGVCSLHFAPNRNRFLLYFDVFESTHDRAVANHSAPSIQRLADGIRKWSEIEECPGNVSLRNEPWYRPSSIPELTVCEECYTEMVMPEVQPDVEATLSTVSNNGQIVSAVPRNFYRKPQIIRSATVCQMASPSMRDLFRRACKREDGIEYLDLKVQERLGS